MPFTSRRAKVACGSTWCPSGARAATSAERGHDFAREQLHRLEHTRVLEVAEPEAAVEVADANHLFESLDLTYDGFGGADHQEAIQQVIRVWLIRHRHR